MPKPPSSDSKGKKRKTLSARTESPTPPRAPEPKLTRFAQFTFEAVECVQKALEISDGTRQRVLSRV